MRNRLYRLVYLWVRDRSLAEDLLQNVFERSFQKQDQLEKHPNLNGWLVRSLKNEALMHFRKESKITALGDEEEWAEEPSPEKGDEIRLDHIYRLLQGLPPKQQEVFQLREVEGLTYEEIAGYLEISLEQVKVNLFRARKTIRDQLIQSNEKS